MKKLLLLAALTAGAAHAETTGVYGGVGFYDNTLTTEVAGAGDVDFSQRAVSIIAGYDIMDYVAVEARFSFGTSDDSISSTVVADKKETYTRVTGSEGPSQAIFAKFKYSPIDQVELYALAGIRHSVGSVEVYSKTDGSLNGRATGEDSTTGLAYGAGVGYEITKGFTVSAEYLALPDFKDGDETVAEHDGFGLVATYKF